MKKLSPWGLGGIALVVVAALFCARPQSSGATPTTQQNATPLASAAINTTSAETPVNASPVATTPQPVPLGNAATPRSSPSRPTVASIGQQQYPVRKYKPLIIPNDPHAYQWWVTQAKFNLAWDVPAGSTQTELAIIDTGFALQHEDFANRWDINTGETGSATTEAASALNCTDRSLPLDASCNLIDDDGDTIVDNEVGAVTYQNPSRRNCTDQSKALTRDCNRIDDDSNGFIDDVNGWDFKNYDNSPQAGELHAHNAVGTTHGTIVAGVAAATGNNGKGLAGVDWNTKILPLQALDDDADGDTLSVSRAIDYAVARGVDVISISLGSDLPDGYTRASVQNAVAHGIVVVAAAGNDGCDCMVYPANYPEVVGVGALDTNNAPAYFSSWGSNLDVLAPGTQIVSSTWTTTNATSAYVGGKAGTSFSTPMVAGFITRLKSQQSTAAPLQLIAAVTENTYRLGLPITAPRSNTLGFGTVHAGQATQRMTTPVSLAQVHAFTPVSTGRQAGLMPSEIVADYKVRMCQANEVGATPVYQATKGAAQFFTISTAEVYKAQVAGYTTTPLGSACLQQPHDTPTLTRDIDLFQDFKNSAAKLNK